jgi:Tfp pilus assembly protein FimT
MMVVVAIIGILASVAVSMPEEDDATVAGTGAQLSGELDRARLRAMATHRWERMVFVGGTAILQEGTTVGMMPPTAYTQVSTVTMPNVVKVFSVSNASAIDPTGSGGSSGNGLATGVAFAPDGTSAPHTIYLQDARGRIRMRLVVFAATGTVLTRDGW